MSIAMSLFIYVKEKSVMIKIFGLRITPFFLLILGLQSLALLLCLYIGIMLYQNANSISINSEIFQHSAYSGLLLIFLLSVLTPGFFYQTKVIGQIKKSLHDRTQALITGAVTMLLILLLNGSNMDIRTLFVVALISASVGMLVGQFGLLRKSWRFLIHSGMN